MKKWLSLCFLLLLAFSLCACASGKKQLSTERKKEIQQAYSALYPADFAQFSPDDIQMDYYGTYGDVAVVMISSPAMDYTCEICSEKVSDLEFVYGSSLALTAYADGSFFTLTQAFQCGLLSEDDLKGLHRYYKAQNPIYYEESYLSATDSKTGNSDSDSPVIPVEKQWFDKEYCTVSMEDNFVDNLVYVILQPAASFEEYTIEDFAPVRCIGLESDGEPLPTLPNRRLTLTLDGQSKENVIKAIRWLEEQSFVFMAYPDFLAPDFPDRPELHQLISKEQAAEKINVFAGDDGPFTVEKIKYMKSVTHPDGYVYALCKLSPHGYAILDNEGWLSMGQFRGGDAPLPMDDGEDYYYVGPTSFAREKNGRLYLYGSGKEISRDGILSIMTWEARVELSKRGRDSETLTEEDFAHVSIPFTSSE